ncbi:MAG TPA: ATPase, partial [Gillisia sp.]|nr:ATPase [Gillisia sp.]
MKFLQSFKWSSKFTSKIRKFSFWLSLLSVFLVIFDLGFKKSPQTANSLLTFYMYALMVGCVSIGLRYLFFSGRPGIKVRIIDIILLTLFLFLILLKVDLIKDLLGFLSFFNKKGWLHLALLLYF